MKPILEIQNVGKKYKIKHLPGGYLSLRERMMTAFKFEENGVEDFWAIKNISFDVKAGESIGIIGRNGAGKSTLLKILSKITPPTQGRIVSRGRIASLLEVGTGFHPELTGRENIFFNGSLLGMRRKEIDSKFDEIVDFSGVEKFLDTPLKHFSSGMQLRLAFAVAAFLEPEILIIDEVLAVGDAEFQRKCLGKMENVSKSGRTIIFVSHNMQSLKLLCHKGIFLKNGKLEAADEINNTIKTYLEDTSTIESPSFVDQDNLMNVKPDPDFKLTKIFLQQEGRVAHSKVQNGTELLIEIEYELFRSVSRFRVYVDVCDSFGTPIFRTYHDEHEFSRLNFEKGKYRSVLSIPANFLAPISYELKFWFGIHKVRMMEPTEGVTMKIAVENTGNYNLTYSGLYSTGMICPKMDWNVESIK